MSRDSRNAIRAGAALALWFGIVAAALIWEKL
jgi:hypothetical protein